MDSSSAPVPPLRTGNSGSDFGLQRNHKMALLIGGGVIFVAILGMAIFLGGKKTPQKAGASTGGNAGAGTTPTLTQGAPDGGLPVVAGGGGPGPGGAAGTAGLAGQPTPIGGNAEAMSPGGPGGIAGTPVIPGVTNNLTGGGPAGIGGPASAGLPGTSGTAAGHPTGGLPAIAGGNTTNYKVQRDDTLWLIARKTLGDGRAWPLIAKANPSVNPNRMAPGTVLKIPDAAAVRAALGTHGTSGAAGATHTVAGGTNGGTTHAAGGHATAAPHSVTVKDGDTLYAIARREYGDGEKWDLIYNANKTQISNPHEIVAGIKLVIPAG